MGQPRVFCVLEDSPYRLPGGDLGGQCLSFPTSTGQLKAPSVLAPLPISFPPVIGSVACDGFVQLSLSFSLWRQQWECEQGVSQMNQTSTVVGLGLEEDRAPSLRPKDTSCLCVFRRPSGWSPDSAGALKSLLFTHSALRNQGAKGTQASWPGDPKDREYPLLCSSHRLDPRPTVGWLATFIFHLGVLGHR